MPFRIFKETSPSEIPQPQGGDRLGKEARISHRAKLSAKIVALPHLASSAPRIEADVQTGVLSTGS